MNIGNVKLSNYTAALAPMAGVADRAFRELCTEFGAGYVVGEMASSKGISMHDKKSSELLSVSDNERPAAVQLFGDIPDIMATAAKIAYTYKPDIIDINMGCPAPKIASSGGGASLMKNPKLAEEITKAVASAVDIPVTVKIRSGWDFDNINAVEIAKRCEQAGASAITIHGRTKIQMYAPPVNIDIIKEVKGAVSIPIIGNGDIIDGLSAKDMIDKTGCDMVMVGRGALGRPWVFGQIKVYLERGEILPEPSVEERMSIMIKHIKKLCEYKGEYIGMREARKHSAWYMKGLRGAAKYRQEICTLTDIKELEALAEKIINMN